MQDHLQLLRGAPRRAGRRHRAHVEPCGRAASRAVLPPHVARAGRPRVKILLWHGYLLGGTGSNVYTRALAREWSEAGHDVTVVSPGAAARAATTSAARASCGRSCRTGCCRCSCSTATRGSRRGCCRTSPRRSATRYVEANAAALRELRPADLVFANHVLLGAPVGAASGLPFRVKAHGSELEYSMRGNAELEAGGAECARARRGDVRRLRAHPRGARGGRRPRRAACTRCRRASTWTSSSREPRDEALAGLSRRRAPTRRTRATRTSGSRRGQRGAPRRVPRRRRTRPSSTSGS